MAAIQAAPCSPGTVANFTRIYVEYKALVDECTQKSISFFPPTVQRIPDDSLKTLCEQPVCITMIDRALQNKIKECSLNGIKIREYVWYHKERCDVLNGKANDAPEHPACG